MPLAALFLLSMTLSDILQEVGEIDTAIAKGGALDGRMNTSLRNMVNRAQRAICRRRNWNFMRDRRTATVASGNTSCNLGDAFKELSSEQSPVSYTYGVYNLPVLVTSREALEARGIWPWLDGPFFIPIPGGVWPIRTVFIEGTSAGWTLNIPVQFAPTTDVVFNISAFYYPADLILATDHNQLTDDGELAEALLHKTRAIAYAAADPSDKRVAAAEQIYEQRFISACYSDGHQTYAGRTLHL